MDAASLKYQKTHEWAHADGDVVTVGITDFAVAQLTDLVYIELPDVGRTVSAGESFGEVESVKAVSDLYSPISGEVIEVNSALENGLEVLSEDAFGAGWIAKIKTDDVGQLDSLMDKAAYDKHCEAEAH